MVDNQIHRTNRIDFGRVALQFFHSIAHGGQVDNGRNTAKCEFFVG